MESTTASPTDADALLTAIEDSADKLLKDRGGLGVPRELRASEHDALPRAEFRREDWQAMAELGWQGILVPEAGGGLDLGIEAAAAVARRMGQWLAPEPFTVTAGVAATLLAGASTEAAAQLLAAVVSGDRIVGTVLDLDQAPTLQCSKAEGGLCLSGHASYAALADPCDGWLLAAHDGRQQLVLVYVDAQTPGLVATPALEVDGRCRTSLQFDATALPAGAVIAEGDAAAALLRQGVQAGRLLCAAELLGAAERLHALTLEYVSQRKQFGKPIGSFQAVKHLEGQALVTSAG